MNPKCFSKERNPLDNKRWVLRHLIGYRQIWLLISTMVFTMGLSAQDASSDKAKIKEDKAKQKELRLQQEYTTTCGMLDSMNFVLEANTLRNARGDLAQVSSNLNFIMVDSTMAIVQIGSNFSMGANGVGGVTAKGSVSAWKVVKNEKRKSFNVNFSLMSPIGMYDVIMFISADGRASATLSGLSPGRLTFDGQLIPLSQSRVFKGRSL
jgi:hypothetical protein